MRNILLLIFAITLSVGFIGCSKDDGELSKTEYADKKARYTQLLIEINNQNAKIIRLREEAKGLSGGRLQVAQEEIRKEVEKLDKMKRELSKLEKELGIK